MHKVLLLACALVLSACASPRGPNGGPATTYKLTVLDMTVNVGVGPIPSHRHASILRAQEQGRLAGPPFLRENCNNPPQVAPPRGTNWRQQAIYDWNRQRICRYVPQRNYGYQDRWHQRGSRHF